jgi:hypothetical protein
VSKPFEVFKLASAGESIWVTEAEDLREATAKAKTARTAEPDYDFFVIDGETGNIQDVELSDVPY